MLGDPVYILNLSSFLSQLSVQGLWDPGGPPSALTSHPPQSSLQLAHVDGRLIGSVWTLIPGRNKQNLFNRGRVQRAPQSIPKCLYARLCSVYGGGRFGLTRPALLKFADWTQLDVFLFYFCDITSLYLEIGPKYRGRTFPTPFYISQHYSTEQA